MHKNNCVFICMCVLVCACVCLCVFSGLHFVVREGVAEEITSRKSSVSGRTSKDKGPDCCAQEWRQASVARRSEQREGAVGDEGRQGPDHVGHCRPCQGSWAFSKKGHGTWDMAGMCCFG